MARIVPVNKIKILSDFREEQENIGELAISIKKVGLLEPILLKPLSNGEYELTAGRRRFAALTEFLNIKELVEGEHFLIRDVDALVAQLEENIKRENFKPLEIANLVYTIHKEKVDEFGPAVKGKGGGWGVKQTAELLSMGPSTVAQYLKMWENKELVEEDDSVSSAMEKVRKAKATNMLNRVRAVIAKKIKEEAKTVDDDILKTNIDGFKLADAVEFLKSVDKVDHVITDPPYGINLDDILDGDDTYEVYKDSEAAYFSLLDNCIPEWSRIVDNGFIIVWCAFRFFDIVREKLSDNGFSCSLTPLIWIKTNAGGSTIRPDKVLGSIAECAVYGWKGNPSLIRKGRHNIFKHPTVKSNRIHVAQKPDSLCKEILNVFTEKNDVVLDCFAGSGSMLRACISTERYFKGCELDEKFYNAALTATLEAFK